MKYLSLLVLLAPLTAAAYCELNGTIYPTGAAARFYCVDKSAKIGPAYTCAELSRVRTCESEGNWSDKQPECESHDSGGCVDWWVDQMSDSSFRYATCE